METERKNALLIVDPQNDFCDQRGSLYVEGAAADIARLAKHIAAEPGRYDGIYISLDSHDVIAVFHPRYWADAAGVHPAPYTAITRGDLFAHGGRWRPSNPANGMQTEKFFDAMDRKGLESLMIWPEHCVVSTWGHQVADTLREALAIWRSATGQAVRFCFKGENPYSEQFSVFEGVDDSWEDMRFNERLYRALAVCASVTFAGEALSHCVEASVASYMNRLRTDGRVQTVRLLADCTSPVTGFDGDASLEHLRGLGVECVTTS